MEQKIALGEGWLGGSENGMEPSYRRAQLWRDTKQRVPKGLNYLPDDLLQQAVGELQ